MTPIARLGRLGPTTSTAYTTVVEWAVTNGELKEVSMVTTDFAKTFFKLLIGPLQFEDKQIMTALTLPFPPANRLKLVTVTLQARSQDGTSITVDGSITGAEEDEEKK